MVKWCWLFLSLSLLSSSSQWTKLIGGVNAQQQQKPKTVLTIHIHHTSRTSNHDDGSKSISTTSSSSKYDDDSMNQYSDHHDDIIPQSIIPNVMIQFESTMLQSSRIEKQQSYDIFDVSYIEFVIHDESIQSKSSSVLSSSSATRSHIFYKSTSSYRSKQSIIDTEDTTTINNETVWFGSTITSSSEYNNNSSDNNSIMGFCSLYSLGGIIHSGTFTTDDATYDLIYLITDQSYIIRSTAWSDYPKDDDSNNDDDLNQTYSLNDNNNNKDSINDEGSSRTIQYPSLVSINPNENNEIVTDWIGIQGPAAMMYNNPSDDPSQSKSTSSNVVVDIVVIVTNRALCEYAGYYINRPPISSTTPSYPYCSVTVENYTPILNKLYQVIAETNNAMRYVNVEIRLKEIIFLIDDGSQNNITSFDPIATNEGGIVLVRKNLLIQQTRNNHKADLVAVIAGNGGNCGVGVLLGYISITNHKCLSAYTFSHEIGHNFGCDHNREAFNSTNLKGYSYAYRDNVNRKYRTIVAYECDDQVGGSRCPRIPYYSSSVITLPDGRILGNISNDNLRTIGDYAPRLASYQKSNAPTYTKKPSSRPSSKPTSRPSRKPSSRPSKKPSSRPSSKPSSRPSSKPSSRPSSRPSMKPSSRPSSRPSKVPSAKPSLSPSGAPFTNPPISLSGAQFSKPSLSRSGAPFTNPPSSPSGAPFTTPSSSPSGAPSYSPTSIQSYSPTSIPSYSPASIPSYSPTISMSPTLTPRPSNQPSKSTKPSYRTSYEPTIIPSSASLPSHDQPSKPTSPTIIIIIPPQPTIVGTKPSVSTSPVNTCFSSINTVVVKDIGDIPLPQLKIGDYVKTHHDDETYTQVYGFGHYDHDLEELFLRMTFNSNDDFEIDIISKKNKNNNNNRQHDLFIEKHHYTNTFETTINPRYLEISSNHLIFVKRHGQQKQIPIQALDVVVGDQVSGDGRQIVTSIERIKRRSVYAPLTQSGELLVSGVHVSNYVNVFDIISNINNNNINNNNNNNSSNNTRIILNQHMIGHILFTPQRLFCQYYIETCKKEYYINGYGLLAYIIISSANIIKYMIGL